MKMIKERRMRAKVEDKKKMIPVEFILDFSTNFI
jgi:hypothetical protein